MIVGRDLGYLLGETLERVEYGRVDNRKEVVVVKIGDRIQESEDPLQATVLLGPAALFLRHRLPSHRSTVRERSRRSTKSRPPAPSPELARRRAMREKCRWRGHFLAVASLSSEYAFGMVRPPDESMPPDSPIYR